jgi:ubiquitin C-terminal hydrolase
MKGIHNIGNTCFINAILQCLYSINDFNKYFSDLNNIKLINKGNKNYESYKCIISNLHLIMSSLNRKNDPSNHVKEICESLKNLSVNGDNIALNISNFNEHNDSEEFLSFLFDKIEDYTVDNRLIDLNENVIENEHFYNQFKKKYNIIIDLFKIQYITQYKCLSCNKLTNLNFNNYINKIELSISNKNIISLEKALDYYTKTKIMEEYHCDKCKAIGQAKERTLITLSPKYLIIQLNRFNNDGSKINKNIQIPGRFSMNDYCHVKKNDIYKLISVTCHIEFNLFSGHYISVLRGKKNKWYMCDDDSVNECSNTDIIHKNGYILFYKKE